MQYPHGAWWGTDGVDFIGGLPTLLSNPTWFKKFMHQMAGAMTMGATYCMSLAAFFTLANRHIEASRSVIKMSGGLGLIFLLVTMWYGHGSAHSLIKYQPMKFAAVEGVWDAEPNSGHSHPFIVVAHSNCESMRNTWAIEVPGLTSLLTGEDSRSIVGIAQLIKQNERKIQQSVDNGETLGYASLLGGNSSPTPADIAQAARSTVPNVPIVFWAFRIMAYSSVLLLVAMTLAVRFNGSSSKKSRRILWICVLACPLPWFAILAGWVVAEVGRQPWVITGVLSTAMAASKDLEMVYAQKSVAIAVFIAIAILIVNFGLTSIHLRRFMRREIKQGVQT